jgi:hypothetical protein
MDEQPEQPAIDEAVIELIERKRAASQREQRKQLDYRHQVRPATGGADYRKAVKRLPRLERKIHRRRLNVVTRRALRDEAAAETGAGELVAIRHTRTSSKLMRWDNKIPLAEAIAFRWHKRRKLIGRKARERKRQREHEQ